MKNLESSCNKGGGGWGTWHRTLSRGLIHIVFLLMLFLPATWKCDLPKLKWQTSPLKHVLKHDYFNISKNFEVVLPHVVKYLGNWPVRPTNPLLRQVNWPAPCECGTFESWLVLSCLGAFAVFCEKQQVFLAGLKLHRGSECQTLKESRQNTLWFVERAAGSRCHSSNCEKFNSSCLSHSH